MFQLPHKLSELATMALDDVVAVSQLPGFKINMAEWYSPRHKACTVCVAGSVMVRHLHHTGRKIIGSPVTLVEAFGEANARALLAIDMLRRGAVGSALACLARGDVAWREALDSSSFDDHPLSRDIDPLNEDDTDRDGLPPLWVDEMTRLVEDLTEAGL